MMKYAGASLAQFGILLFVSIVLVSGIWYFSMHSRGIVKRYVSPSDEVEGPIIENDIYMDDSIAKELFQEVRVFCLILTTKSDIVHKAAAVNFTWAKRCNKHLFVASEDPVKPPAGVGLPPAPVAPDGSQTGTGSFDFSTGKRKEYTAASGLKFSTVGVDDVIFIDSPDGWENLNEKTREVVQLLYMTELENFDWFLKADDDTFMVMENLRFLLRGMNSNKPAYLGYHLEPPWYDWGYMSGGSGYVLSREGLRLLVQNGLNVKGACKDKGSFEDVEIGRCALTAGVKIYSSVDKFERETFHPDRLQDFIPGPPQDWLFKYARNRPKGGSECCSQFSISFHRMTPQDILVFDHLLYRTSVYGRHVTGAIPEFFKRLIMKKTPMGLPTMKTS